MVKKIFVYFGLFLGAFFCSLNSYCIEESSYSKYAKHDSVYLRNLSLQLEKVKHDKPDSAFFYLKQLTNHLLLLNDTPNYLFENHYTTAELYLIKNSLGSALFELESYILSAKKFNLSLKSSIFLELGKIYYKLKLHRMAIQNYEKALAVMDSENQYWVYPVVLINIGLIKMDEGHFEEARKFFFKSYYYRLINLDGTLVSTFSLKLVGQSYIRENNLKKAKEYLYQGMQQFEKYYVGEKRKTFSNAPIFAGILYEIIHAHALEKNTDSMTYFSNKLIAFLNDNDLEGFKHNFYINVANDWIKLKNPVLAKQFLDLYRNTPKDSKTLENERDYAFNYALVEQLRGNKLRSLEWKIKYFELHDSLLKESNYKEIINLTSYALEHQNDQIQEKKNEQIELAKAKIIKEKQIRWVIIAIAIMLLCAIIIVIYFYKKSEKERLLIYNLNQEKELLINEIHHRVKNNLMVVSGILDIQQDGIKNAELQNIFVDAQSRINSIALVHQNLYEHDGIKDNNITDYFEKLFKLVYRTYIKTNLDIKGTVVCKNLQMNINTLIPLALITNELLTNSFKFAFVNRNKGNINITITPTNDGYEYIYTDDGIGKKVKNTDTYKTGLGTKLIEGLAMQLNGIAHEEISDNGVKYIILFKGINNS